MAKASEAKTKTRAQRSKGSFSDAEKAAMQERARELKAEQRRGAKREKGEAALAEAIEAMPDADRAIAERIAKVVAKAAPDLLPKTWYGMPAWANDDGKVVCFLQAASKFDTRYATFGFNDSAALDDGAMWPTSFAIAKVTRTVEQRVRELVERAVG